MVSFHAEDADDAENEDDAMQDQEGETTDQPRGGLYDPNELDDLVDHDHAVVMDDLMNVEMANDGFSVESGLVTDLDGEPVSDHGEPFTDDFTEIFDNLGHEPDDEAGEKPDDKPEQHEE